MAMSLAVAGLALGVCAGAQSILPNTPGSTSSGPVYRLPTAMIDLEMRVKGSRVSIAAGAPRYVGDPSASFALNAIQGPFNAEIAQFEVGTNDLLSSVQLNNTGRSDETLVNAAKSAGAFLEVATKERQNAVAADALIFSASIDIARLADDKAAPDSRSDRLKTASSFAPWIHVERIFTGLKPAAKSDSDESKAEEKANFEVGSCYRLLNPYRVATNFAGERSFCTTVEVPNGSPDVSAATTRGLLADRNTVAKPDNGVLTAYRPTAGSELDEAAASLFKVVVGAIAGTG